MAPKEGKMRNIRADKGNIAEEAWLWIVDQLDGDAPFGSNDEVWDAFWRYAEEWAKVPEHAKALEDADMDVERITDFVEGVEDIEKWYVERKGDEEKLDEPFDVPLGRVERFKKYGPTYGADIGKQSGAEVNVWHESIIMSSWGYEEGWYKVGLRGVLNPDDTVTFSHYWWADAPEDYVDDLWPEAEALIEDLKRGT